MTQPLNEEDQRRETELVAHMAPEQMAHELVQARKRLAEVDGQSQQQQPAEEPVVASDTVPEGPADEPADPDAGEKRSLRKHR